MLTVHRLNHHSCHVIPFLLKYFNTLGKQVTLEIFACWFFSLQVCVFMYESKCMSLPPENMKDALTLLWRLPVNVFGGRLLCPKALCDIGLHWVKL